MDKINSKGFIFDVDGVLLDSMIIWENLASRYIESLGLIPEERLNQIVFSMSMEQGAEYLCKNYPLGKTPKDVLTELHNTIRDFYFYEVEPKGNAIELLKALKEKEIKMTAATSSPREHVTAALTRTGLISYIDSIFTTTEVGESKHSPLVYNVASESMNLTSNEVTICEDSLYALVTAKNAGYTTVGIFDACGEKNQDGLKAESNLYVNDLSDVIPHLA